MTAVDVLGFASLNAVPSRPSDARSFGILGDTYAKDCTTPASQDGTQILAGWYNSVAGNFRALIRANGNLQVGGTPVVAYDQADDMTLRAVQNLIQRGQLNFAVDQGAASHILVTLPFQPAELIPGLRIEVVVAAAPTGPTDLTLTGFPTKPVKRKAGLDIVANDWAVGDTVVFRYTAAGVWRVVGLMASEYVAPTFGASSSLVPKAPALIANCTGAAPTYIPVSIATRVSFGNTSRSNIGTTTWSGPGARLTIGANEAGIWGFTSSLHMPQVANSYYSVLSIYKNGIQLSPGNSIQAAANTGQNISAMAILDLAVNDYIEVFAYQQYSSPLTSVADNTSYFSGALLASY